MKRKYHQNLLGYHQKGVTFKFQIIPNICKNWQKWTWEEGQYFLKYFANAVKTIKSKIKTLANHVWWPHPIRYKTRKVFKFSYVSKIFFEKQLKAVQHGKSTRLNDIPPGMIKDCAQELSKPLAFITNLSINTGRIPSLWKKAKVIPIHKGGNSMPENFRPISVLPIFSMIVEPAVKSQFLDYFRVQQSFYWITVYGFRQQRSTKLASNFLFDDMRKNIDDGYIVEKLKWILKGCWRSNENIKIFWPNELLINLKKGKNSETIKINRKRSLCLLQRTDDQQRCLVQILR